MNKNLASLWTQIYQQRLALLSLFIAISSLAYNTWRNESTEAHRNTREAAFIILQELGELEQIVSYRHYFSSSLEPNQLANNKDSDWIRGWGKVSFIRDISQLLPNHISNASHSLIKTWQDHAAKLILGPNDPTGRLAEQQIDSSIVILREIIIIELNDLN